MRDRLIELLKEADKICKDTKQCEKCIGYGKGRDCIKYIIADHLLAEGVIVPPCKVGDMVYWAFYDKGEEIAEVFEGFIRGLSIGQNGTTWFSVVYNNGLTYEHTFEDYWNNTVFLTREEAEKALEGRNQ